MNASHIPMTSEAYHATDDIGSSMIETFRSSRTLFHGLYVAKTIERKPASPAMELGTLVHLRILEPEKYYESLAPELPATAPDGDAWNLRKPAHREAKAIWEETHCNGKVLLSQEDREKIEAMAASVFRCKRAWRLIEGKGEPEYSIFWTDNETGLKLKCRVDWFSSIPVDLKTTKDPNPLSYSKDCVNYGYFRKRYHYEAGIADLMGEPVPMVHLAVGSNPPYDVAVYELDDADSRTGERIGFNQWRESLRDIAKCYETGDWSNPWGERIVKLSAPSYAFTQDQYSI
jgi:hypothetical protein